MRGRKSEWKYDGFSGRWECSKGYIFKAPSGLYTGFVTCNRGIWQVESSDTLKAVKRAVVEKWKELQNAQN